MFSRILVGYLDTEQGNDALELGRIMAQANWAELLVFTAPGEDDALANGAVLRVYAVARRYAHPSAADASGHVPGVPTEAEVLEARALPVFLRGIPATELVAAAELGVDMLVLGSRSGGPSSALAAAGRFAERCTQGFVGVRQTACHQQYTWICTDVQRFGNFGPEVPRNRGGRFDPVICRSRASCLRQCD